MRRKRSAIVVIFCVVVVTVMAAMMPLFPSRPTTRQSELNAITETIRSAFLTRGQACMAENHERQAQYQAALNQYWSPATPNPSRIATLTVAWAAEAPTMEPALHAEIVATAQAEYRAGIIDERTYLYSVDPAVETPDWSPNDSPRDAVHRQLRNCQARPGYVGFGVASVYDAEFSINGDVAEGTTQIAWWATITDAHGAQSDRQHDERYRYLMEKQGSGPWLIRAEMQVSGRQGP